MTVLHRLGKCLDEILFFLFEGGVVNFIFILENVYFYGRLQQNTRIQDGNVTGCLGCMTVNLSSVHISRFIFYFLFLKFPARNFAFFCACCECLIW